MATPQVTALPMRRLGDLSVSAVGLGCMPLSFSNMRDERPRAVATIHRALDLGINFLDTSNIYAPSWDAVGHNEELIAEALNSYQGAADLSSVVVTTKGGITRGEGETWGRDSSADGLVRACEESLEALGTTMIDLYQHHRQDPSLSYEAQMQAVAALRDRGYIRRIGISNAHLSEVQVALDVLGGPDEGGLVSVQNEYSPRYRGESDVLELCSQLGIAFLPWSPLGGSEQAKDLGSNFAEFAAVGQEVDATAQEVTLAWLLALTPVMIPIPGATRPETIDSIVRSAHLSLTADQMDRLNATSPMGESMYPEDQPRSPLR
jgi:aryl-alcohol dehydrogenase-like predicted oxidoreductase